MLDAVSGALSPEFRSLFDEHVRSVNLVQRHGEGREVNMYRKDGRKVVFPERKLIEDVVEIVLATVSLRREGTKGRIAAKVWVVNGDLFEIIFNARMARVKEVASIEGVKLNEKFFAKREETSWQVPDRLAARWKVRDANPPLDKEARTEALSNFEVGLPDDYVQLMAEADGFRVDDWLVLGLEDVYETPGAPGTYVLAERRAKDEGCDLALVARPGRFVLFDVGDMPEIPVQALSFGGALDEAIVAK